MEEIEVKIFNINKEKVVEKLILLGAKKVFDGEINTSFFDFADKSILNNKKVLRLRKAGDKAFLTFKNPVSADSAKISEEYEVEVSDFDEARKILESLGLSEWLTIRKHRLSYALDDAHFELDKFYGQYKSIPEFLEIEAGDIKTIYNYAELLGFKKEDCKPWTFSDVVNNLML